MPTISKAQLEAELDALDWLFRPTTYGELFARMGQAQNLLEHCRKTNQGDATVELCRLIKREEIYQQARRTLLKQIEEWKDQ